MSYRGTRITEPPTFEGAFARAWRVRIPSPGLRVSADHDATVGVFIVHAPRAHPVWHHYAVSVVHLRSIHGVKPADILVPGATHQLMILALNPDEPLPTSLDAGPEWQLHWLTPIDVLEQFAANDDAVADQILELAVRAIVDGRLSPDQDWRHAWKQTIADTAAHFRSGHHSVTRS